jgi:hypothetical protein
LYVHAELPAKTASSASCIDTLLGRWRAFLGVHRWLVANVQR